MGDQPMRVGPHGQVARATNMADRPVENQKQRWLKYGANVVLTIIVVIVLGCGGMADLTDEIREAVGLPIVEGVTAAVKLAESLASLRLGTSKHGDLAFPRPKSFTGRFQYLGA